MARAASTSTRVVEVHDEADLERALALDADVIGINNRNLDDLSVDVEHHARADARRARRARPSSPRAATSAASRSRSWSASASTPSSSARR